MEKSEKWDMIIYMELVAWFLLVGNRREDDGELGRECVYIYRNFKFQALKCSARLASTDPHDQHHTAASPSLCCCCCCHHCFPNSDGLEPHDAPSDHKKNIYKSYQTPTIYTSYNSYTQTQRTRGETLTTHIVHHL